MKGITRNFLIITTLAFLYGCVSPATVEDMVPDVPSGEAYAFDGGYNLAVSGADGGYVTNAGFQSAAIQAFDASGVFSDSGKKFIISASILSVVTDNFGLDLEAKVRVKWELRPMESSKPIWAAVIATDHTATVGDNFVAAQRIQTAVEEAAKKNIQSAVGAVVLFAKQESEG